RPGMRRLAAGPRAAAGRAIDAALRYRLLGDTGPQVALGCPGWLFYRDGLRPPAGAGEAVFAQRVRLMRHWARQLQAQGVHLLVVVPDKSRIEQAHTCGLRHSAPMRARLGQWQQALAAEIQGQVLDALLQLHGGYGYSSEYGIGRAWADARAAHLRRHQRDPA
uniref:alginate O-acetyltransferase AlgX-related protein n=3 Tax=Xanthomonas campestris pv. translucens TaxID=343 RepID=UPI000A8E55BC